jgi:hypothetical protein
MVDNITIDNSWKTLKSQDQIQKGLTKNNPYRDICEKISQPNFVTLASLNNNRDNHGNAKKSIRLGFVSLFTPGSFYNKDFKHCSDDVDVSDIDRNVLTRHTKHLSEDKDELFLSVYIKAIEQSLKKGADITVVNEMGFPNMNGKPNKIAIEETKKLMQNAKKPSLIIAGSTHDSRTISNSGFAFFPSNDNDGKILTEYYHKQVSAIAADEYICVPPERKSLLVEAYGYFIGIIICLDLLDYSVITSLLNHRQDSPDFILIPAYTKNDDKMKDIAQKVSRASASGVGIINALIPNEPSKHFYICGIEVKDKEEVKFPDSKLDIDKVAKHIQKEQGEGYEINYYDIYKEGFREARSSTRVILDQNLEFLFALPKRVVR